MREGGVVVVGREEERHLGSPLGPRPAPRLAGRCLVPRTSPHARPLGLDTAAADAGIALLGLEERLEEEPLALAVGPRLLAPRPLVLGPPALAAARPII